MSFIAALPAFALSERIVHDPYTGLAIDGYDPVAYFIVGKPVLGRKEREVFQGNVFWRFDNEGNQQAFVAHPQVYQPAYGGYSALSISRGLPVPGDPQIFVVRDGRLFLFATDVQRQVWLRDPESLIEKADRQWPDVRTTLSP